MSSTSSSSFVGSGESDFPGRVKLETRRLAGGACWTCSATPVEVCHVFAKGDHQLESLLISRGLLSFDLASMENAIALCPTCHTNFDNTSDPGFFFVPADLEYFIRFEKDDYLRRTQQASIGLQSPRVCPDAMAYQQHQHAHGEVPAQALGGLYQRIFLQSYLPFMPQDQANIPKSWHGHPMAAIRRAILATGTMRLDRYPEQIYLQIRELQKLYSRADPELLRAQPHPDTTVAFCQVGEEGVDTTTCIEQPRGMVQAAHGIPVRSPSPSWIIGPNLSVQDILHRYQHLLS
ncbi:conserved hypothetical protein [Histoplasma capsulatum H143]|uniref:HNH nuclease domain-containing protein n=1 Tax=Ajellomyces capsulatus (strain H143) TaxID=544712 RepID=C6HMJ7_AJECH|nr:conserved hypothetical protein [Histoplasma capsulatum H143]